MKNAEGTERSRRFHISWKPYWCPGLSMHSQGFPSFKHWQFLISNLVGVFRDTSVAIGVARILSYIKEGIKIQLEGVNLHGIELRAGRNIMWNVAISFSGSSWKRCDKSGHRRRQDQCVRDFKARLQETGLRLSELWRRSYLKIF